MNKVNPNTVPSITFDRSAPFDERYKVSPLGNHPGFEDDDCYHCETRAEAEKEAARFVIHQHYELRYLLAELDELRTYLMSPKFHEDTTVQVADVLARLEQLRSRAHDFADTDTDRNLNLLNL